MKRIVLDTNIVVSAFLWGGTPRQVISAAIENGILLLSSDEIINEVEQTLNKLKFDDQLRLIGKTREQIVSEYAHLVTLVPPAPVPEGTVRDSKDDIVLATAVGGKADTLVSGDKDLTDLKEYQGIVILTPAQCLSILFPPTEADEPPTKNPT